MIVFRVCNTLYAKDLGGEGARLFGGRWNSVGVPCLYTSESRSLAVLEFSVNVNTERILRNLSIIQVQIPDEFFEVKIASLPGDWRESPAPSSTREFGSSLLRSMEHLVIRFPSSIIPQEYNFIINPLHPRISSCKIREVKDFVYDIRIKK